jgi:ABC-2 type transport system ATP-binding protein
MSDAPILHVDHLTRSYGQVVALNDVSLDIQGGVVGLLGPNGAGKSTLLRTLTGELRPGIGDVTVLGMKPFANPDLYARIGICPEQDALLEDMTATEFVSFLLRLRGLGSADAKQRARAWLDRMGLSEAADRKLGGYSKGMRQRVKLCTAFAHEPELLFLDEPMTGLDPLWRHHIQTLVRERAAAGATILFSSHVLHEVEQVTREVVLLNRGRVAAQGNSREIRALLDRIPHRVKVVAKEPRKMAVRFAGWECVESVKVLETGVDVTTLRPDVFYRLVTEACAAEDLGIEALSSPDDSLQALFDTLVNVRPDRIERRAAS